MMKFNKEKIIGFILNIFACAILFLCLALSTVTLPKFLSADVGAEHDFFSLVDEFGIPIAFGLTVLALMLIYVHQKMLFARTRAGSLRKEDIAWLLEKTELRYRGMFDSAPIGVFQVTLEGQLLFSNIMAAAMFGHSSVKEFIKAVNGRQGFVERYVRSGVWEKILMNLREKPQAWQYFQEEFRRVDGTAFYASIHIALRYDADRDEECLFGFIEDQTARITADEKLRDSEERYRGLIDNMNTILLKLNRRGEIVYLNKYAQEYFGFSETEALGRHMTGAIFSEEVLSCEQAAGILDQIHQRPQEFFEREAPCRCKDGRDVCIFWSFKAMVHEGADSDDVLVVGIDITARKRLEESLQKQLTAETLLQELSTDFFNAPISDIGNVIKKSLERLNCFFRADCFYSCFFDTNGFVRALNFCSVQTPCSAKTFIERFYLSSTSWWIDQFQSREVIFFQDRAAIAAEFSQGLGPAEECGVEMVAAVPVFHAERFVGFIGFNKRVPGSECDEKQVRLLRMCGEIFFNALDKRDSQKELIESRKRMDFAVRGAYLGMYDWDIPSGNILYNDIWFRMLGFSPYEFPHHLETWKSLVHPDDLGRVTEGLDQYLKGNNPFFTDEYRLRTKAGDWKWIQDQGHVVERDDDHNPVRMVGLHRDITELKKAEEQLRYQHNLFGSLIEHMPVGIFAKDVKDQFRLLIWNNQMEVISGLKKEQVLGRHDHEIFEQEMADVYLKDDIEVVRSKRIKHIQEERFITPLGEKSVRVIKVPIVDQDKVVLVFGLLQDMTDEQQLETQLRHTQKMNAVGQLAAGVAHEVKNPLAIILLAAEGLSYNPEVAQFPKVHSKIKMIKDAAVKANKVVMELLRFSRLSEGELERVDLHKVIDDAHFLAQNKAKGKYITFEKRYCSETPVCWGNAVLLEQVFVNLFGNAIDAIEKSGEIIITTAVHADVISIEVKDTGSGIPDDIRSKIFDPFFTTKEIGEGTGLGLNTVFTILEKLHGHIRVESEVGQGTAFIMTLPYAKDRDPSVGGENRSQ